MDQQTNILITAVKNACKGDMSARAFLYKQYGKAMFNVCMRMTANRENAEDILQESFMIAFNKLHQLKDELNFGGWLRKIVIGECIRLNKKTLKVAELDEQFYDRAEDNDASFLPDVSLEKIHEEIKMLPEGCRQVFNLYVLENYSHKQIAEALGLSESTSKSQYHRARQLLKDRITKQLLQHGRI